MSTIPSKQHKRHDPTLVLTIHVLILALLVFAPQTGNLPHTISGSLATLDSSAAGISNSGEASFVADQQYWDANCSHGWSLDSTCENIVLRAQSCSISLASAYCSQYDTYLQKFRGQ